MIGFISGSVISLEPLIIETQGLGYQLLVSNNVLSSMRKESQVSLWVYTCLRQDSLELYGFESLKEKELFLSLIKVRGIGPKMAIRILGSCSSHQFLKIIQEEDIKALTSLPHIGKKTAQQIILSLKEKLPDTVIGSEQKTSESQQLFYSLEKLGFHPLEIRETLKNIKWEEDFKKNFKQALSLLRG